MLIGYKLLGNEALLPMIFFFFFCNGLFAVRGNDLMLIAIQLNEAV